ncbi:MAG TPA: signal peptide peptidase SppA [Devosia sp.]|nr:signal peptide peptidase SppA [Devosia sp.]
MNEEPTPSLSRPDNKYPLLRALRRSRGRWRMFGFVALALAVLALGARLNSEFSRSNTDYIALVSIEGVIVTDARRMAVLEDLEEDENVKAVIVRINSPGGTTAGGEEIYEALSALRANKPVVAVINELGASAAYMAAVGTDRIFARRLSIVGSIGVLFNHMDASGLLNTIGIDFDKVVSGPLKAEPDADEPMSDEVRASLQNLVDDSYNWFVDIVADRRGLSRRAVLTLADGRIVNGRVAHNVGLVDEFGGQAEAINWLETLDVGEDLPVWQVYPLPESFEQRFIRVLGEQTKTMLGLDAAPIQGQALNGLVSLWQL